MQYRPVWLNGPCLAAAWVALLVYGTLVPFDFDLARHADGLDRPIAFVVAMLASVTWQPATGSWYTQAVDVVTNLLLYGPLGFFLRLGVHHRRWGWWPQMAWTLGVLFAVSYLLECAQSLSPSRVGSWYDVATNTTGGLVFAAAAVRTNLAIRRVIFFVYRKFALGLRSFLAFTVGRRHKRMVTRSLFGLDGLLIVMGLIQILSTNAAASTRSNWLPFVHQFEASYDVAMMQIAYRLVHHGLFAVLVSVHLLAMPVRHRAGWLAMAAAFWAAWSMMPGAGHAMSGGDVTEPVLAVMATGALVVVVHGLAHAVRRSDRRKLTVPVEGDCRRY